jgi:hypothetical protein
MHLKVTIVFHTAAKRNPQVGRIYKKEAVLKMATFCLEYVGLRRGKEKTTDK